MAWVSLLSHANKQPRYLNTDTCSSSSSSPYAVNCVSRTSWESLAAACYCFHAHKSLHNSVCMCLELRACAEDCIPHRWCCRTGNKPFLGMTTKWVRWHITKWCHIEPCICRSNATRYRAVILTGGCMDAGAKHSWRLCCKFLIENKQTVDVVLHFKVDLERRGLKPLTTDVAINSEALPVGWQHLTQLAVMIHLLGHGLSYLASNTCHDWHSFVFVLRPTHLKRSMVNQGIECALQPTRSLAENTPSST